MVQNVVMEVRGKELSLKQAGWRDRPMVLWLLNMVTLLYWLRLSAARRQGRDRLFSLTIDYQEKAYSAGKIPGGFLKERADLQRRKS